jgi:hypothetical protein
MNTHITYTIEHMYSSLGTFTYNKEAGVQMVNDVFDGQKEDGMISQIMDDGRERDRQEFLDNRSRLPVTPILSTLLWYMVTMGFHNKSELGPMFNRLMIFYDWYVKNRDPNGNGIISTYHPWEALYPTAPDYNEAMDAIYLDKTEIIQNIPYSNNYTQVENVRYMKIMDKMGGSDWDNKTIYDEGLFNVCDPMTQFIFIKACKDLYKIAVYLDKRETYGKLEKWIEKYTKGCDILWNNRYKAYSVLDIKTMKLFDGISCGGMLYSYADIGSGIERGYMKLHTKRILCYTTYGFPSKDDPSEEYNCNHRWSGSIWCFINLLLVLGIHDLDLCNKIRKNTLQMIEKNGYFEYINPYTRKTYGSNKCRKTEAISLLFKSELFD